MPGFLSTLSNSLCCVRSHSGNQVVYRGEGSDTQQQSYRNFSCSSCFCGMSVFGVSTVEKMTIAPLVGLAESSRWYYCVPCCCLTSYLTHVFCDKTAIGCRENSDGSEELYCSFKKNSCREAAKKVGEDIALLTPCFSGTGDQQTTICPSGQQNEDMPITRQPYNSDPQRQVYSDYAPYHHRQLYGSDGNQRR